jgi:hypothetical protein
VLRIRSLVLFLVSFATASVANAQTVLSGQVIHKKSGAQLEHVAVHLIDAKAAVLDSATTGPDGTFLLKVPGAGSYRVHDRISRAPSGGSNRDSASGRLGRRGNRRDCESPAAADQLTERSAESSQL